VNSKQINSVATLPINVNPSDQIEQSEPSLEELIKEKETDVLVPSLEVDRSCGTSETKSEVFTPSVSDESSTRPSGPPSRLEKAYPILRGLLPSQQDVDIIIESTIGWLLVKILCRAGHDLYRREEPMSTFNMATISMQKPIVIARTLLYLAICIQQLPPEFDATRLQLYKGSSTVEALADTYISKVADWVTSKDELISTIEGLECLLLQGIFHVSAGNLRLAWLSTRRALAIAQLLNLRKEFMKPLNEDGLMSQMAKKQMWTKVVYIDNFWSLNLDCPCGTGDDCFGDEEENFDGLNVDNLQIFERKLSLIAGRISVRNQKDLTTFYSLTQQIEEKMDLLFGQMSRSWWEIPFLDAEPRSREASDEFDRTWAHLHYFLLRSLLHLPFWFKGAPDAPDEHHRRACLNASREVVLRYLVVRKVHETLRCRLLDFTAFVHTMILSLDHLRSGFGGIETPQELSSGDSNISLIRELISSFEVVSHRCVEPVARQGAEILRTLLAFNARSRSLRLTVPYFGTFDLISEQPGYAKEFPGGSWEFLSPNVWGSAPHRMGLSFKSSQFTSQRNIPDLEQLTGGVFDHIVFDSIMRTDIEAEIS
jgi:hypothetical protein